MIRTLRPHEPIPDVAPARYPNSQGYVRLRWRINPGLYVEDYEHRVVMGRPRGMHVHHLDDDKANNDPTNLLVLTPAEHSDLHGRTRGYPVETWAEARHLYEVELWPTTDISDLLGIHTSVLSRGLRRRGVAMRSPAPVSSLAHHEGAIVDALNAGARVGALAREYGVRHIVVDAIRKRHNLPGRPPGRPRRAA